MMGTTTRQTIQDFKARLKDDEISIIPNDIMKLVIDVNTNYQERLVTSQERIAVALERIAGNMETQTTQTENILTKLDAFNTTISGGTTILADAQKSADWASVETELETLLTKKHNTEWKVMRSKELSVYYRELLQMTPPFVPEKCRSKVFKNQVTRESIKKIHNEEAIHNAETQIRIMETQVAEWSSELESIKLETNNKLLVLDETKRNDFNSRIQDNEQRNISNWKVALSKITKQYEDEMNSGADQFLLKYTDEIEKEQPKNPKNFPGRGGNNRGGRGRVNTPSSRNNTYNNKSQ